MYIYLHTYKDTVHNMDERYHSEPSKVQTTKITSGSDRMAKEMNSTTDQLKLPQF